MMPGYLRAVLLAALLALSPTATAQAPPTEYQLKAVFLLNFARYVGWSELRLPAGATLLVCILGRDPFGPALALIDGKQAQGRETRIRLPGSVEEAAGCHVPFIAESEAHRVGALIAGVAGQGVLTVSDMDGFADQGGAIGLVNVDDRIGFDINQAALRRDQLKARSQLLRLARRLLGTRGP